MALPNRPILTTDERPEWIRSLAAQPLAYQEFLEWLQRLDAETLHRYDGVKGWEDFLRAKGAREFFLGLKSRLTGGGAYAKNESSAS